jgi:peptide/nickel transport system permease protein
MASTFRELLRHRTAAAGLVLVTLSLAVALACPWIAPDNPAAQHRGYSCAPPGTWLELSTGGRMLFAMGTDELGRDIFTRVLYGARISLAVGLGATLFNLIVGIVLGLAAGYYGRWADTLLMRVTDMFFAFPGMLLAIIILATLNQPAVRETLSSISSQVDPGLWGLILALGATGWTGIARVIRSQVLALKEQEFVEAARAAGCSNARIIFVHLLPNCLAPVIVLGTMQVAYNILNEAGLSFLGLGVQPPAASWGGMLSDGRPFLASAWWWGVFPGLALAFTVLGFNLFGDGLRDVLDPKLKIRT